MKTREGPLKWLDPSGTWALQKSHDLINWADVAPDGLPAGAGYALGGQFSVFKATIGLDETGDSSPVRFRAYVDSEHGRIVREVSSLQLLDRRRTIGNEHLASGRGKAAIPSLAGQQRSEGFPILAAGDHAAPLQCRPEQTVGGRRASCFGLCWIILRRAEFAPSFTDFGELFVHRFVAKFWWQSWLRIGFILLAAHACQQPDATFFPMFSFACGALGFGAGGAIEMLIPDSFRHPADALHLRQRTPCQFQTASCARVESGAFVALVVRGATHRSASILRRLPRAGSSAGAPGS